VSKAVLDASALMALLRREPGADAVAAVIPGATMAMVNLAEVLSKLVDYGAPEAEAFAAVSGLGVEFVEDDLGLARASARWRERTRNAGLSLGDRICLALGERLNLPLLTADRAWAGLGLPLTVHVIR
jgi:ribonuclease VapC